MKAEILSLLKVYATGKLNVFWTEDTFETQRGQSLQPIRMQRTMDYIKLI